MLAHIDTFGILKLVASDVYEREQLHNIVVKGLRYDGLLIGGADGDDKTLVFINLGVNRQ